ncbi:MAG: TerD family protein [Treponema sp.]|jgi:tellurium resistance protein TerD|nr:TerD family protein [Treponema sp.]
MSVSLKKGAKVSLAKRGSTLSRVVVGLGWDMQKFDGGGAFDLDASAFLLGPNGKVYAGDEDFVFYGQLSHPSKAIEHTGDNRTGEGEGDDEQIRVDLSKIPERYESVVFTVTIHDADDRKQNFGQVENAFIRIVNEADSSEILRYDLEEDYSNETAIVFAELFRKDGGWDFHAIGDGYNGGLAALCAKYGVEVE